MLDNNKGMTITSALIGAAMVGGLSLVLVKQMETGQKTSRSVAAALEVEQMHARVLSLLKDPRTCKLTFWGAKLGSQVMVKKALATSTVEAPVADENFALDGLNSKIRLKKMRVVDVQAEGLPLRPHPYPARSLRGAAST